MQPRLASAFGLTNAPALDALAVQVADYLPPPLGRRELAHLLAQLDMSDREITRVIRALAEPEAACPGCVRDAGAIWPAGATSRSCARHIREFARQQPHPQRMDGQRDASRPHQRSRGSAPDASQVVGPALVAARGEHPARRPPDVPTPQSQHRSSASAPARRLIHTTKKTPTSPTR